MDSIILTPLNTAQAVRAAFDELDLQQLAVFARLSPTRRLQVMFDLCEFSRQMIIASERQRAPLMSDEELAHHLSARTAMAYGI